MCKKKISPKEGKTNDIYDVYISISISYHSTCLCLSFFKLSLINHSIVLEKKINQLQVALTTKSLKRTSSFKEDKKKSSQQSRSFFQKSLSAQIAHYPFINTAYSASATFWQKGKVKQQNFMFQPKVCYSAF